MNYSTMNFTTPETSTNSTTQSIGLLDSLEISLFFINFLFGVPTHSYIIWLIVTGTESIVAAEFFLLNLSICEIGNSLNCFFNVLSLIGSFTTLSLLSHVSSVSSRLIYILQSLGMTGRPLFQCLICVERYLAVVHPVTFLKYKPLRYRVICCTAAWMIILGSCLFSFLISIYKINYVYAWFFSLQFLLFLSVQLFCLVAVLRALKQSGPGERGRERKEENHMKRRAFKIILITTVSMVIIYPVLSLHCAGKLSCPCTS
ncbi:hydroxycarboxylic acid receptor 2-like [Pseudorasbora parva]|uniref:hydroxycarboxylic acid receptor 2-like n=1 Tax=Pseudorasbora parva TaxID=51549 RepID=UPI00351DD7E2